MCNRSLLVVSPSEIVTPTDVVLPETNQAGATGKLLTRRAFGGVLVGAAAAVATAAPLLLLPSGAQAQPPAPQPGWRACSKCGSLYFDGFPDNKGRCPKGGGHEFRDSFNYIVPYGSGQNGSNQAEWRACGKCQVIFYDGFPDNKGKCPAGGGHERSAASFNYVLKHDVAPAAFVQNAWRYCSKCAVLFYDGSPNYKGVCPAGGGHEYRKGLGYAYLLGFLPPPPPPPTQLDFNASPIGFKSGIAAGGWSHLTLFPDGRYQYKGHFHDSGAVSYKVGSAWMVRSASGVAFEFAKAGSIAGTLASGSRDLDWDITGTNPEIQRNWADLLRGSRGECRTQVDVTIDIADLISQVKKAVEVAGEVIKVVQVVAQLVG